MTKKNRSVKVYGMSGYKYQSTPTIMLKGNWLKELSNLIAIAAGLFSLFLFMLLYCSYQTHSWGTTATVVVMLVVFGLGYKLAKLILFPLKGLTALPFLRIIDKILGGAAGAAEFVAIAVALQYVLILLEQPVLFAVPELL